MFNVQCPMLNAMFNVQLKCPDGQMRSRNRYPNLSIEHLALSIEH